MNNAKRRTTVYIVSLIAGVLIVVVGNHILRIHDPATMWLLFVLAILTAWTRDAVR